MTPTCTTSVTPVSCTTLSSLVSTAKILQKLLQAIEDDELQMQASVETPQLPRLSVAACVYAYLLDKRATMTSSAYYSAPPAARLAVAAAAKDPAPVNDDDDPLGLSDASIEQFESSAESGQGLPDPVIEQQSEGAERMASLLRLA